MHVDNQKRIVYLTFDFLEPIFSGNGTLSRIQIFGLLERGFKLLVICPGNEIKDPQTSMWINKDLLNLICIPIESVKNLSPSCDWRNFFSKGLNKIDKIKQFDPHLIISSDWHTIDLAIKLKESLNIPLISQFFRIFSYFKEYIQNEEDYNIVNQKEIALASNSDLVVILSCFDQEWSQKNGAAHTHILYPPLSEEFIQSLSVSTDNPSLNIMRFITVSRLVPEKNILRVFPILKELENLGVIFSYTLIGEALDDRYEKKIHQTIQNLKFNSKIKLLGRITLDEMITQLRKHPIYIHTSSYEPFGIAVTEAASAGCTIVFDQDGLIGAKDLLINHPELSNYLQIDFNNPNLSAKSIKNLVKTIQLSKQNKNNSTLISKLSPTQYVENLVKIFRDFL